MDFSNQPFVERFKHMGDEAEAVFTQVRPYGAFARNGWDRPEVSMATMSAFLRNKPDFYSGGNLVEVMGMGTQDVLKLKEEKYEAWREWNKHDPVVLFVWSSHHQHYLLLDWERIKSVWRRSKGRGFKTFPDNNKRYLEIPWAMLESLSLWGAPFVP